MRPLRYYSRFNPARLLCLVGIHDKCLVPGNFTGVHNRPAYEECGRFFCDWWRAV